MRHLCHLDHCACGTVLLQGRVPTLLLTKNSRTFPGLSRTPMNHFPGPVRQTGSTLLHLFPFKPLEKCTKFKDIFQDFPGPGIFKKKNPGLSRRRGNPVSSKQHKLLLYGVAGDVKHLKVGTEFQVFRYLFQLCHKQHHHHYLPLNPATNYVQCGPKP